MQMQRRGRESMYMKIKRGQRSDDMYIWSGERGDMWM